VRIHVDAEKCIGGGQCVLAASELFDQDDDGIVVVLRDRPSPDEWEAAQEAAEVCPARVIEIIED
jgi:ferredoxin